MDFMFWFLVIAGAVLLLIGVLGALGRVSGSSPEQGWLTAALGANAVIHAIARYRSLPDDHWVRLLGFGIVIFSVAFYWQMRRRRRSGV